MIRVSDHLSRKRERIFTRMAQQRIIMALTKATVTKKIKFVIGGPGQYNLPKKKNGKQTAKTAAKPYAFP